MVPLNFVEESIDKESNGGLFTTYQNAWNCRK